MAIKPLVVKIVGEADFKKATSQIQTTFGKVGKAAAVGVAAIGAATAAAAAGAFKLGQSFDSAYDGIVAGTGATGTALEDLKGSFDNVLTQVPSSMGDVSIAIADVNTALGLTGEPLENLSTGFLDLARVSGGDLSSQIKSTTRLFGDWGVSVDDQALALDKLWTVSQATGIGISELGDQMVKAGAPLRQLGFSLDESAALFGKWNKEGVNTEIIFSGVRTAISKMAKAGKDIPTEFAAVSEAIKGAATASEGTAIALEVFGAKAGPDMAAAIREGRFEIDDLVAAMDDAEGAIAQTSKDTESFSEKWSRFKNQLAVAFKPAALAVFDALGVALDYVGPILNDVVIPAVESFFAALKSGESNGSFIERVALAFRRLGEVVGPIISEVVGGIQAFVGAWKAADGDVTSSGLPGFMEGLANLIQLQVIPAFEMVASRIVEVWEKIGPRVTEIFGQLQDVIGAGLNLIVAVVETVVAVLSFIWRNWGDEITAVATVAWNLISGVISGALDIVVGIMRTATALLRGDWSAAWAGIKQILSGVWNIIKSLLSAGWAIIRGLFSTGAAVVKAVWSGLWNAMKAFVTGAWSAIKGGVSGGVNAVGAAVARLPGKIRSAARQMWNPIYDKFKAIIDKIKSLWSKLSFKVPKINIPGLGSVGGSIIKAATNLFANGNVAREPIAGIFGEYQGARHNPEITTPESLMTSVFESVLRRNGGGNNGPGINIETVVVDERRPMWRELDELENMHRLVGA